MQQTEKYKFNIIETSDAFGPEALNGNAQKLETALNQHEAAVDSALKSQTLEWQAADTALSQTIAAVEEGARLFHLAGPVNNDTDKRAFSISLSGIDITKYRALLLIAVTNDGAVITCDGANFGITGYSASSVTKASSIIWIFDAGYSVKVHCTTSTPSGSVPYVRPPQSLSTISAIWEAIDHLDCNSNVVFLDVYGIRA